MKKIIIIVIALILVTAAFLAGRRSGIDHALMDSEIWTVTRYNPEDPEESAWNGYDQEIFINLDGWTYSHGMIQG